MIGGTLAVITDTFIFSNELDLTLLKEGEKLFVYSLDTGNMDTVYVRKYNGEFYFENDEGFEISLENHKQYLWHSPVNRIWDRT